MNRRPKWLNSSPAFSERPLLLMIVTAFLIVALPSHLDSAPNVTSCAQAEITKETDYICWEGSFVGLAKGNIYNDLADTRFTFRESKQGTLSGEAHARMLHWPQTLPGGCTYTRSQDPEEFTVAIDGRRNADQFQLNFGYATATYKLTAACRGHGGSGSMPGMDAFMGASGHLLHPATVPAKSGLTRLSTNLAPGYEIKGLIELACKRWTYKPGSNQSATTDPSLVERTGELSPDCSNCPVAWELVQINSAYQPMQIDPKDPVTNGALLVTKWLGELACLETTLLTAGSTSPTDILFCSQAAKQKADKAVLGWCYHGYHSTWRCPVTGETIESNSSNNEIIRCPDKDAIFR